MEAVLQFLYGGICIMCIAIAAFFGHQWRAQSERLLLWFAVAFLAFAASWGVHLAYATSSETGANVYIFRLIGFIAIGIGIVEKNRRAR